MFLSFSGNSCFGRCLSLSLLLVYVDFMKSLLHHWDSLVSPPVLVIYKLLSIPGFWPFLLCWGNFTVHINFLASLSQCYQILLSFSELRSGTWILLNWNDSLFPWQPLPLLCKGSHTHNLALTSIDVPKLELDAVPVFSDSQVVHVKLHV